MEKIGGAKAKESSRKAEQCLQHAQYSQQYKWWIKKKACHLCWLGSFVHFFEICKNYETNLISIIKRPIFFLATVNEKIYGLNIALCCIMATVYCNPCLIIDLCHFWSFTEMNELSHQCDEWNNYGIGRNHGLNPGFGCVAHRRSSLLCIFFPLIMCFSHRCRP